MLDEPFTALTDYLLAAVCAGCALALARGRHEGNRVSSWLWCAGFWVAAAAATVGGTYHGVRSRVEPATVIALWSATMFSMGVSAGMFAGALHTADITRSATRRWFAAAVAITAAGAAIQQGALSAYLPIAPNPTYHLIQVIGLYCLFRCARSVRDRHPTVHGEEQL